MIPLQLASQLKGCLSSSRADFFFFLSIAYCNGAALAESTRDGGRKDKKMNNKKQKQTGDRANPKGFSCLLFLSSLLSVTLSLSFLHHFHRVSFNLYLHPFLPPHGPLETSPFEIKPSLICFLSAILSPPQIHFISSSSCLFLFFSSP